MLQKVGYGERDATKDFWGNPYRLENTATRIIVRSAGPDGIFGTKDDIVNGYAMLGSPSPGVVLPPSSPMDQFKDLKGINLQASLSPALVKRSTRTASRNKVRYQKIQYQQAQIRTQAQAQAQAQLPFSDHPRLVYNIRMAFLWIKYFGQKVGITVKS